MRLLEMGEFDFDGAITALKHGDSEPAKKFQLDIMDRYDMMPTSAPPSWKDVATIPYALAVIGACYVRSLFAEKLFKDLGK